MRARTLALVFVLVLLAALPHTTRASAPVLSQFSGVTRPYTAYAPYPTLNDPKNFVATGTLEYITLPVMYYLQLKDTYQFYLRLQDATTRMMLDCQTQPKTVGELGISKIIKDMNPPDVTFGPFYGSQCAIPGPGGHLVTMIPIRVASPDILDLNLEPVGRGAPAEYNFVAYGPEVPDGPKNSNILFLPGLEASRLYGTGADGNEKKFWEPWGDADAAQVAMDAAGLPVRDDLYTRDVISNAYAPVKGNVYKSFLEQLASLKADKTIADYGIAPYDWRLGLDDILSSGAQTADGKLYYAGPHGATTTPFIIQELRRLAQDSRTGKVTIVAHSNGGLLAKALVNALGADAPKLIDKLIFVAVPQVGTPQAIGAILHGYDQALPVEELSFMGMTETMARTLSLNLPSVYNLLPSAGYFTYTDDPVITISDDPLLAPWRQKYGPAIHSSELLQDFLTDTARTALPVTNPLVLPAVGNSAMFAEAESVHTSLDVWTPPAGISLTEIAGWGRETLSGIEYYQGLMSTCTSRAANLICTATKTEPVLEYRPKLVLDGDGTVVVPSALWMPTSSNSNKYWVDLNAYNSKGVYESVINRKHADILEVQPVQSLIEGIIKNQQIFIPPQYISTSSPVSSKQEMQLHFTLHSPLSLDAYDDQGNHTGVSTTTNSVEENIPGSQYLRFGEVQFISVPEASVVRVSLQGVSDGSFTLDAEEMQGTTVIASTTFAAVPTLANTLAHLDIAAGGNVASSTLAVDENGDGVVDLVLRAESGAVVTPDFTPPEAVVAFSTTTRSLLVAGRDTESPVNTISLNTFADAAGNTIALTIRKTGEETRTEHKKGEDEQVKRSGELKISLEKATYTVAASTTVVSLPKNTLQYSWEMDKKGALKNLEQRISVRGSRSVHALYDARHDTTKILTSLRTTSGDEEGREGERLVASMPGLVILRVVTSHGKLEIEY